MIVTRWLVYWYIHTCTQGGASVLPPPPAYQQEAGVNSAAPPPPKYVATPVPLPTYAQSEHYEKEGVLPPSVSTASSDSDSSEAPLPARRWFKQNGTCFEFVVFFSGKLLLRIKSIIISFACSVCYVQCGGLHFLILLGYQHSSSVRGYCWIGHSLHLQALTLRGTRS